MQLVLKFMIRRSVLKGYCWVVRLAVGAVVHVAVGPIAHHVMGRRRRWQTVVGRRWWGRVSGAMSEYHWVASVHVVRRRWIWDPVRVEGWIDVTH